MEDEATESEKSVQKQENDGSVPSDNEEAMAPNLMKELEEPEERGAIPNLRFSDYVIGRPNNKFSIIPDSLEVDQDKQQDQQMLEEEEEEEVKEGSFTYDQIYVVARASGLEDKVYLVDDEIKTGRTRSDEKKLKQQTGMVETHSKSSDPNSSYAYADITKGSFD